jgi:hypothetical protein
MATAPASQKHTDGANFNNLVWLYNTHPLLRGFPKMQTADEGRLLHIVRV